MPMLIGNLRGILLSFLSKLCAILIVSLGLTRRYIIVETYAFLSPLPSLSELNFYLRVPLVLEIGATSNPY